MATRRIQNRPQSTLQAEQKIAFALLMFLGIGGIVFGFRSFGANLYRPIQQQFAKYYTGADVVNADSPDAVAMEEQKKKDTDGDGLSDYDELYVYHTSPYLKDSDSDGIDDKTEVFAGTDPNCPKGKDCGSLVTQGTAETTGQTGSSAQGLMPGTPIDAQKMDQAVSIDPNNLVDVSSYLKTATIQNIRDLLIKSGMKKEDVDKVNDADLQKMFDASIQQAQSAAKSATPPQPAPPANTTGNTVAPKSLPTSK